MSYAKRCLSVIFLLTALFNSINSPSFARRAYSYGGDADAVTPSPTPEVHARAESSAPKKAAAAKKVVSAKKHAENDDDDYSILNVFAPAPITASPAKSKATHKPVAKTAAPTTATTAATTTATATPASDKR